MNLVVDTCVWSLVLRRRRIEETNPHVIAFRRHVEAGDSIHLLGSILQELLDGVESSIYFDRLEKILKPFPMIPTQRKTHILASQLRNHCCRKGIQASPIDFLIAAACLENGYPLLTSDNDFLRIASHSELILIKT